MSDVSSKWGELVAKRGFAQIPNYLLLANQFLDPKLTAIELLLLIQLAGAWWKKGELPFPSVSTLAVRCGVSNRQVQRTLANLEKRELVKRVIRRSQGVLASNAYDLSGLVALLERVGKAYPNQFPRKLGTANEAGTADQAKASNEVEKPPNPLKEPVRHLSLRRRISIPGQTK